MLWMKRKDGEEIVIGDNIVVAVKRVQGGVGIGVEAPRNTTVHRREVYDAIQRSKPEKPPQPAP